MIQIDLTAEELHNSVKSEVAIQSDLKPAVQQLVTKLKQKKYVFSSREEWWVSLKKKCSDNINAVEVLITIFKILNTQTLLHYI